MRNKEWPLFILFITIFILCQYNILFAVDEFGVRARGLGNAYVSLNEEASGVFWNPAGPVMEQRHLLSCGYGRPYAGINNAGLKEGYLAYIRHFYGLGSIGLFAGITAGNIYSQLSSGLNLGWRTKIDGMPFSAGVNFKLLHINYDRDGFEDPQGTLFPPNLGPPADDPLFREYGYSRSNLGIDLGLRFEPHPRTGIGLALKNLNRPNMAINDEDDHSKYPLEVMGGVSYSFTQEILTSLDLVYTGESISDNPLFNVRGGIEGWLWNRSLGVRAGGNMYEIDAGLTWRTGALFGGLEISYAFTYPLSELREVNGFSHRFDITIRGREAYIPQVDIAAYNIELMGFPEAGEFVEVAGTVKNVGRRGVDGFSLNLAYTEGPDKPFRKIFPTKYLEYLPAESTSTVIWRWKPMETGSARILFTVDDDGSMLPELNGKLEEEDEKNNSLLYLVDVEVPLIVEIEPALDKLEIEKVTVQKEEEPIVPVVFFNEQADRVKDDYLPLLYLIAERLMLNPDVRLGIKGFYEPESDKIKNPKVGKELANFRALRIYEMLSTSYPVIRNQLYIISPEDYDPSMVRIKPGDGFSLFKDKVAEENRRVEFTTTFAEEWDGILGEIGMDSDSLLINNKFQISNKALILVKNNEDLTLMVEGYYQGVENRADGFARAMDVHDLILSKYPALEGRIRFLAEENPEKMGALVYLESEGIIFKPKVSSQFVKEFINLSSEQNSFSISIQNTEKVDGFEINIVDQKGNLIRALDSGKLDIPKQVVWDWKDEYGRLIVPGQEIYCQVTIDRGGWKKDYRSRPLKAVVTSERKQIENLILVEYVFDETRGSSQYLEARIVDLAKKVIGFADRASEIKVVFEGHTDNIGTLKRNQELSDARAGKELENFLIILSQLNGFTSAEELEQWLRNHNIAIEAVGYADRQPMMIDYGYEVKELGDNNSPHGRTINRRVETQINLTY
ncbi:type IX secretion system membrane protein PorP/SprF [bacterium]|nr:type IX secretion system membrane protein PorP/SprF [bacterium]